MDIPFIDRLAIQLTNGLPGRKAHIRMAPFPGRFDELPTHATKNAAVMILIMGESDQLYFPLIKRNPINTRDPHKGQVSLPGGRQEASDYNLLFTALRETQEEIGIPADQVKIVGALSPLFIPVSNNLVHPFIGWYEGHGSFIPQVTEVYDIIPCSLAQLSIGNLRAHQVINTSYATDLEVPGFNLNDHWIWGATAMIIEEFNEVLEQVNLLGSK